MNFMKTFDRLLVMAKNCDSENGNISDSLAQTGDGLLYNRMRDYRPEDLNIDCEEVDTADYEEILERSRD